MRISKTVITRRKGRDFLDKEAYKAVREARAIKTEGYLKSIEGRANVSREFHRRGTIV